MLEVVEDKSGTKHLVNKEDEGYYRLGCLKKLPSGNFYNGEYKGDNGLDKDDFEVKEVESVDDIEKLCERCKVQNSDESTFEKSDTPPAEIPLLGQSEDDVEVNRVGMPSKLERRLIKTGINKLRDLIEKKGLHEDLYGFHVDADTDHQFLMVRVDHEDVTFSRKEINEVYEKIQDSHNFPRDIGDMDVSPAYGDDYEIVVSYSFDKKTFENKYYREYGELPTFVNYDNFDNDSGMYAGRVVFG